VREAEQAGTASKLDVARAEQQFQQESTTLEFARRDTDTLVTMLLKSIGAGQQAAVDLSPLPDSPAVVQYDAPALVQEALAARPEFRSLQAKRQALGHDRQKAERQRWPELSFAGDFGAFGQDPNRSLSTYTVAGTLTIPIWTSGRIEAEIRAARVRVDQWEQEQREQELAVQQEIARAIVERQAADRARQSADRSRQAARETLELARLRYSAGLTTNLDVVTAQGNLAQADEEEIRARYDGLLADARLARARGNVLLFVDGR
jgi:outer membrane protein TolC